MPTENTRNSPVERIIVGATCFADSFSAIDFAFWIAQEKQARIEALLLQDESVFQFASFFTPKVVPLRVGRAEAISPVTMAKALERDARAFKERLRVTAEAARVDWVFEQRTGPVESLFDDARTEREIVLLGSQPLRKPASNSPIVVVMNRDKQDERIVEVAENLSSKAGLRVQIETISMSGEKHSVNELDALMETLGGHSQSAVLIQASLARAIGVQRLQNAARCPLIVFPDSS